MRYIVWDLILSTWEVLELPKTHTFGRADEGGRLWILVVSRFVCERLSRLGPVPVDTDSTVPWVGFLDWIKRKMLSTDIIVFYFLTVDLMWPFVFCLVLHTFLTLMVCVLQKLWNKPIHTSSGCFVRYYVTVTSQAVRKREWGKLGNGNRSFKAGKYKIVFFEMTLESNDKKGNMNLISVHAT